MLCYQMNLQWLTKWYYFFIIVVAVLYPNHLKMTYLGWKTWNLKSNLTAIHC